MTPTTDSLYLDLGQRLRAFIAVSVRDEHAVEDIYQEIFIKIHLNLATIRDEERIVPWIFQVARNAVADYFRSRKGERHYAGFSVLLHGYRKFACAGERSVP